ncbi:MAG: hypothetical protein HY854_19850 [Burkholderiales bacterium]|nr:hypothetical protein [Burkholderiales bacterium]
MKFSRQLVVTLAVIAVAVAALVAAWLTVQEHQGRPDRPLDVPVVRAPPIGQPDTAVVGGPPSRPTPAAPASRNSRP